SLTYRLPHPPSSTLFPYTTLFRSDERLGDAGRHLRERRLLNVREAAKGVHDAPYRAEQADVGTHRSRRGEKGQMALEEIHLALRSEEHTSELQSRGHLVCRLLLEK